MVTKKKNLLSILPSNEELTLEFDVNPAEFNKQVKALSIAAKKLTDMGFYIFGGDGSGRLVSTNKEDLVVAHLDGIFDGGVGDDLTDFESND